jgi:hypothetical protein
MPKQALFRMESIQESNFSIDQTVVSEPEEIDFDIEGGTLADSSDRTISVSFDVIFSLVESGKPVLRYTADIKFYIDNFENFVTSKDGDLIVDELLSHKLVTITLHTIRGMLFAKTAGTGLASCYLPIIS